jgi:protein-L-isoaspartate O-methyltransferase
MPESVRPFDYDDRPVPIGLGQTIGPPYIVALMTELAAVPKRLAMTRSSRWTTPGFLRSR